MEGVARYIHETTKRMVLAHPEDEFHFIFDRPYDPQFIYAPNVVPHILSPKAVHPTLWYLWFQWRLPTLLKKINPAVLYSGFMQLPLKGSIPSLMVSHDLNYEHHPEYLTWSSRKYMLHYSKKFHEVAHHIVSVSQTTKDDIFKLYGIAKDKITVAYNAAPEGFRKFNSQEKRSVQKKFSNSLPYFVYVGSLHPRKNVKNLLLAFDQFKDKTSSNHQLLIYGRAAWQTSEIYKTYENLKYKQAVKFISNEKVGVPEIMAASEALCYVSKFEGFGIPILEGFHSQVPVMTSNCSSMPEVAQDAALLIDPFSIDSIANGLIQLSTNDELRQVLVERGNQRKLAFDWNNTASIIYNKLEDIRQG